MVAQGHRIDSIPQTRRPASSILVCHWRRRAEAKKVGFTRGPLTSHEIKQDTGMAAGGNPHTFFGLTEIQQAAARAGDVIELRCDWVSGALV